MSRTLVCCIALVVALMCVAAPLSAQTSAPDANALDASAPAAPLRINSRAVLVDVVVTDKSEKPVTGLKRDEFSLTEQGKLQTISFFEEHKAGQQAAAVEVPKLPPNVFSNFRRTLCRPQ